MLAAAPSTTFGSRSAIRIASASAEPMLAERRPLRPATAERHDSARASERERAGARRPQDRASTRRRSVPRTLSPKCSRTTGATSRRVHCSRSSADSGPQPTKSSGPSESPRVQRAVAAAAGVGDAAPVDRLVAGRRARRSKSPACGALSADQTRASGSGYSRCAGGRPRPSPPAPPARPRAPSARRAGRRRSSPGRKRSCSPPRSTTAHSPLPAAAPALAAAAARRRRPPAGRPGRPPRSRPASPRPSAGSARSPSPGSR